MFKKISLLATLAVAIFALPGCFGHSSYVYHSSSATAVASVAYYGPHPVYDLYGDADWCSISGAHTHSYAPDSDDFYVINNGRYVFVGDPSYYVSNINFNTYYYMGEHPLNVGNGWCYIQGPHRHHWAASGYYNYTRVGSYNYYTYYGARNSYYDPGHVRYDLHSYYSSHPPVRYTSNHYGTVGMNSHVNYGHDYGHNNNNNVSRPNNNAVYTAPVLNNSSHSSSSNVARPSYNSNNNSVSRPSSSGSYSTTTVSRPSTVNSGSTVSRPSTGSTVSRPSTGSTVSRPSSGSSASRPSSSRPSSSGRVSSASGKTQYMEEEENNNSGSNSSGSSSNSRPSRSRGGFGARR